MNQIPLFKSCYSVGRSILTLDDYDPDHDKESQDSIIQIAVENKLDEIFLVEDSLAGIMEADDKCQKNNIQLNFGLRLSMVNDSMIKEPDSWNSEHKIVIFAKNNEGYKNLIKISTAAHTVHSFKRGRLDFKNLKQLWSDDLILAIPFYDSFIYNNNMTQKCALPEFFTKPYLFKENNNLPFDFYINSLVDKFVKTSGYETLDVKSVYYHRKEDYDAWVAFKCMNRKTYGSGNTLEKPNLEHCFSDQFCFECV